MNQSKWHAATVLMATAGSTPGQRGFGLWLLFVVEGRREDLRVICYTENPNHTVRQHGRKLLGDMARVFESTDPKEWIGKRLGLRLRELKGIPIDGIQSIIREVCAEADIQSRREGVRAPAVNRVADRGARFEVDLSW